MLLLCPHLPGQANQRLITRRAAPGSQGFLDVILKAAMLWGPAAAHDDAVLQLAAMAAASASAALSLLWSQEVEGEPMLYTLYALRQSQDSR